MERIYYMAVYNDSKGKVYQVTDDIDCLDCEILASPRIRQIVTSTVRRMVDSAMLRASVYDCHHLEINCSKGNGSYQWLRIKPLSPSPTPEQCNDACSLRCSNCYYRNKCDKSILNKQED